MLDYRARSIAALAFLVSLLSYGEGGAAETAPKKDLPLPGQVFSVEGATAFVILPPDVPKNRPTPWVWYAPTLPGLPEAREKWMFDRFLASGIAIAGIDVG